jgi:8-oxo-dGTP pyrophosphatase MutT (NUDIX family)
MKPAAIRYLHSAGGVIFRRSGDLVDVALIATKKKTVWTLPKGIIDKNESPEMAAVREIQEETGLTGAILDQIGEKSYWFFLKDENVKCKKTVTYFLLEYISGDTSKFSWEVDEARWVPIEEASGLLAYRSDREVLLRASEKISQMK